MFYNNLLSIPVLLLCSLFLEDWSSANISSNFPEERRTNLMLAMLFSGLSSVFISYTSAWCVRVTSSTTYSMVGALNKLPIALSGLVFFDAPVTLAGVTVSLNPVGGDWMCKNTDPNHRPLVSVSCPASSMHWRKSSRPRPRAEFCRLAIRSRARARRV